MTIKSMTAYGSGEFSDERRQYRCEIKTLNSRFIDVYVKLPKHLVALESEIISLVKKTLTRGKVDVFLDIIAITDNEKLARLNHQALDHYIRLAGEADEFFKSNNYPGRSHLSLSDLLRLDGVLETQVSKSSDLLVDVYRDGVLRCVKSALQAVIKGREKEGEELRIALKDLIDHLQEDRSAIQAQVDTLRAEIYGTYKKRLEKLLAQLEEPDATIKKSLPEERVLAEVAILVDKADIEEELIRLASHQKEFLELLKLADNIGRKLDFLCQEMHREANTISSKIQSTDVSRHTLAMKEAIERLRQQVQNIE